MFRVGVGPCLSTSMTFNPENFQARKLVSEARNDVAIRNAELFQVGTIDCIDYCLAVGSTEIERRQVQD
jgi:hypothetical protein